MQVDAIQYALLGLISSSEEGVHGYRLKAEFDSRYGDFWVLNYGQMYRALAALERGGLIEGEDCLQTGRPNKRVYRVSVSGRECVEDWLLVPPSAVPVPLRDDLALRLLFLTPERREDILALVRSQRTLYLQHLSRVSKKRARLAEVDGDHFTVNLILLQADLRVRADLAWLDHVEHALESLARS